MRVNNVGNKTFEEQNLFNEKIQINIFKIK